VLDFEIRVAEVDDAAAMGVVMVESFLSAHRGQLPEAAFRKREEEWTPEVSARAWARTLAELPDDNPDRAVVMVAEDEGGLLGLVAGGSAEGYPSGVTCEIGALYVDSRRRGQGVGRALLHAAAGHLADLGYTELHISVLSANGPARAFYEAMGGRERGQGTADEEGFLLPLTIYGWTDVSDLRADRRELPSTAEPTTEHGHGPVLTILQAADGRCSASGHIPATDPVRVGVHQVSPDRPVGQLHSPVLVAVFSTALSPRRSTSRPATM